jgi:hypothetical protein
VARFFHDLTEGFQLDGASLWQVLRQGQPFQKLALRGVLLAWLAAMITLPLAQTVWQIVSPAANGPVAMAAYLDERVSREALIETWEPEMGFLTDHNYHFPPPLLLNNAVGYIWLGGEPPAEQYDFVQTEMPDYVLVGEFARWVEIYPTDMLKSRYELVDALGGYELYARKALLSSGQ